MRAVSSARACTLGIIISRTDSGTSSITTLWKRALGWITHRVAKTLQREAHRIDHRHSSSHQAVAQLDAQEILLPLRRAVPNRIKQRQVHSPNTRQHQRITLVTLALMLMNRSHLARIRHHYPPAKCFQKSTDPRTMRSRLHHPERTVITTGQLPQRDSIVTDAVLLDYFSPLIQRTKPVPAISQIQSYRNVTALGLLLHRRRAYLSAIPQTLFAFSSNLVRRFGGDYGHRHPEVTGLLLL